MTLFVIVIGNTLYHFNIGSVTQINSISVLVIEAVKWMKVEQYDLRENN